MNTREAVVSRLQELMDDQGLKVSTLAIKAGMPQSTVKSIFNGASQNPGVVTLNKLCIALGTTLPAFFNSDLFK